MEFPKLPIGQAGEAAVHWITAHGGWPIEAFGIGVGALYAALLALLGSVPAPLLILLVTAAAWRTAGRGTALFAILSLFLIWNQGLWASTLKTVGLTLTSAMLALLVAVPVGIAIAESRVLRAVLSPLLNFLQTMPRFVYLIPAVIILGIDVAPAVFATLTLAVVPPIRLTALGIMEVDRRLVEAGDAMGATPLQRLVKIKLPMAVPSIILGVNQCLMMCLSMIVIAALIGASGLGDDILRAISQLNAGDGIVAGFGVFTLAVLFDRITRGSAARLVRRDAQRGTW